MIWLRSGGGARLSSFMDFLLLGSSPGPPPSLPRQISSLWLPLLGQASLLPFMGRHHVSHLLQEKSGRAMCAVVSMANPGTTQFTRGRVGTGISPAIFSQVEGRKP